MLGIVLPVWLNDVPVLWDSTRRAVASWPTALAGVPAMAYVVPQRLHTNDPAALQRELESLARLAVAVMPLDTTRGVAAAWNAGIRAAAADGCDRFLLTANDCYWHPGSIAALDAFGRDPANADVLVWTGRTTDATPGEPGDYSGAMLGPDTLARVGWFDERFKPAYFEDNDYQARVALAGGISLSIDAATFDHAASLTKRCDAEAAHHVDHWFRLNRQRYYRKWGLADPPRTAAEVRQFGYAHPWNDPALPITFWDRD